MAKPFPLSMFPNPYFADVTLVEARLSPTELDIITSDSEWGLESDVVFFYGPGVMTFTYTGAPRLRWRNDSDRDYTYVDSAEPLEHVSSLDLISRSKEGWIFRFRAEQRRIVEVILPKMVRIQWSGDGEDLETE